MPAASVSWSSSGSTRADRPGPTNQEASMDTPVLSGELIVLRPVRADDADAMWDMVNDPEGTRLTGTPATLAREQVDTLSLIHISEPTRLGMISYAVFCLKK